MKFPDSLEINRGFEKALRISTIVSMRRRDAHLADAKKEREQDGIRKVVSTSLTGF